MLRNTSDLMDIRCAPKTAMRAASKISTLTMKHGPLDTWLRQLEHGWRIAMYLSHPSLSAAGQ